MCNKFYEKVSIFCTSAPALNALINISIIVITADAIVRMVTGNDYIGTFAEAIIAILLFVLRIALKTIYVSKLFSSKYGM
ncbi:MAG: hypothetical protein ACFCUM_13290 [Bacteroidales bacterium]